MSRSAWQTWQQAGRDWASDNPNATPEELKAAAALFGNEEGWPPAGKQARTRAFTQGAKTGPEHGRQQWQDQPIKQQTLF